MMDRSNPAYLPSESSIPAPDDAPIIKRTRLTMDYLLKSIRENSGAEGGKAAFLLNKILGESLRDLSEVPPDVLEFYLSQAVGALYWTATGVVLSDLGLPPDFPQVDFEGNPFLGGGDAEEMSALRGLPTAEALQ